MHYHGSKISGSQRSFLAAMAICIVQQWKKSMGYCSVPKSNHALKIHTVNVSFFVFAAIFAGPWIVEVQKFCFHDNVM